MHCNKKRKSLEEVANELNMLMAEDKIDCIKFNKGKLSKWENDIEEPKLSALKYVADYYEVSIDEIIDSSSYNLGIPIVGTIDLFWLKKI